MPEKKGEGTFLVCVVSKSNHLTVFALSFSLEKSGITCPYLCSESSEKGKRVTDVALTPTVWEED